MRQLTHYKVGALQGYSYGQTITFVDIISEIAQVDSGGECTESITNVVTTYIHFENSLCLRCEEHSHKHQQNSLSDRMNNPVIHRKRC